MEPQQVIDRTRRWISSIVIGLNLCPFAERVFNGDGIRYMVSDTTDAGILAEIIATELQFLASGERGDVETTLVIHPRALLKFVDYNDFLNVADRTIQDLGLGGIIQVASFHPDYQFAGTDHDSVENYTNRSPYPMVHLLREESISAVATDPKTLLEIPRRNIETLGRLGIEKVREILNAAVCALELNDKRTEFRAVSRFGQIRSTACPLFKIPAIFDKSLSRYGTGSYAEKTGDLS